MKNPITKATEKELTFALKERHRKRGDYFGSQIKMGSAGNKILDGLAIPITWSPRTIIGYEIKVTRSDFLSDQKYPHYMETCNLFYFVAPKGLIKKDELPKRVGLLEYNNGKLRQVKRAVYEKVDVNVDMLLHCIFYKLQEYERPKSRQEHLDDVKASVESKDYGTLLGRKIYELSRNYEKSESTAEMHWRWFAKEFEKRTGLNADKIYEHMDYFNIENKKHNKAIELLQLASNLFEK